MRANGRQLLRHVYLRRNHLQILHAAPSAWPLSARWSQCLGLRGVGYLEQAEGVFDINTVFAGVLVLTACALVLDYAVTLAERGLLRWRPGRVSANAS